MIEVKLPIRQEDIPGVIKKLNDELMRIDGERRVTAAVLQSVQEFCDHHDGYTKYDYGGGETFCCSLCGYRR